MKELTIGQIENLHGGGTCGFGDYLAMGTSAASIVLLLTFPPAGTALALGSGLITGISTGTAISCLFY
jgi:hypothetical protein